MAVADILDLEKLLPFHCSLTDHHQILQEYCFFDLIDIADIDKSIQPYCKMAAADILDFEKLLPFL